MWNKWGDPSNYNCKHEFTLHEIGMRKWNKSETVASGMKGFLYSCVKNLGTVVLYARNLVAYYL